MEIDQSYRTGAVAVRRTSFAPGALTDVSSVLHFLGYI